MLHFLGATAQVLHAGLSNLLAYLAAHVLLCLLPAFFIAGGMAALLPKEAVTRLLGRNTPKLIAYPAAAAAASLLAVCSCTIVPLFAGIHKKGAGLGPAITFLFFAPAANILALAYTGTIMGPELAIARLVLSLTFGVGIGLLMALLFRRDDLAHDLATDDPFAVQGQGTQRPALAFVMLWVLLLLAGTLKIDFLTSSWTQFDLAIAAAPRWQARLDGWFPYAADRGEEGVSLQGVVLLCLLAAMGVCSWRGLEHVSDGVTAWTRAAAGTVAATLLLATLAIRAGPTGLQVGVTGRSLAVLTAMLAIAAVARWGLSARQLRDWLWESWHFVKQIILLLMAGVFAVGMIRAVVRPEWIEMAAGSNTLAGNLAGVAFGVFMYFPTLVEVPVAKMFLDLGTHPGPLLAYLMADPKLSLQSILIVATVIGRKKAWTYVGLVAAFSTAAGLFYGAWHDGVSPLALAAGLAGILVALAALVAVASRRSPVPSQGG
ncbi:MAG: permease [Deltaproteobacteria bacterium]|nr:permease [Deltaproteobacteria bacterium]